MNDGTRTRDIRHHKPALYQLSYAHHGPLNGGHRTLNSREPTPRVYYSREANSSTTAADTACTCSVVGPGAGTKAALR